MPKWPEWWIALGPVGRITTVFGLMFLLAFLLVPGVGHHPPTPHGRCVSRLRMIAMALEQYHKEYGAYPPLTGPDGKGHPQHSWRVLILPYAYGGPPGPCDFHLDEPWNSPHNREVAAQFDPEIYICPAVDKRFGKEQPRFTSYLALPAFVAEGHWKTGLEPIDRFLAVYEVDQPLVRWNEPFDVDHFRTEYAFGRSPTASLHGTANVVFLPTFEREQKSPRPSIPVE